MGKLTRSAFAGMIRENLEWLEKQPDSLENIHIAEILKECVSYEYPLPSGKRYTLEDLPSIVAAENEALRKEVYSS